MFLGFIKNIPLVKSLFSSETKKANNVKNNQSEQNKVDFEVIVPTSFKQSEVLALENKLAEIYDEKSFLIKSDLKAKKIKLIIKSLKSEEGKPSLVLEFNSTSELLKELKANKNGNQDSLIKLLKEERRNEIQKLSSESYAKEINNLKDLGVHICPPGCNHEEIISKNESNKGTESLYESLNRVKPSPPTARKINQSTSRNTILGQALQKLKKAQSFEKTATGKVDELIKYLESIGEENEAMHEKLSEGIGFKTLSVFDSNQGYDKPENVCLDIVTKENNNIFKVKRYKLLDYLKNSETLPFAVSELNPDQVHSFMHNNRRGFQTSKIFLTDLKNKISSKPANKTNSQKSNKTKTERPIGFKILKETLLQQLAKIKDLFTKLNNDSDAKKPPSQTNSLLGNLRSSSTGLLSSSKLDMSLRDSNLATQMNLDKSIKNFLHTFSEPSYREHTLFENQVLINELENGNNPILEKIKEGIPKYLSANLNEINYTTSQLKQKNLTEQDKAPLRKKYVNKRIDLAQRSDTLLNNFNFETDKLPPNIKSSLEQSSKEALDFARDLASKPEFKNTYENSNGHKKSIEINQVEGIALTGEKTILPDNYLNNVEAQSEFRNSKEEQYREILDAIPENYNRENLFKDEVAREVNSSTAIETPSPAPKTTEE